MKKKKLKTKFLLNCSAPEGSLIFSKFTEINYLNIFKHMG